MEEMGSIGFPSNLTVLLHGKHVKNVSETEEITEGFSTDLLIIEILSKALGFSYKVYSKQHIAYGDFLVGDILLYDSIYVDAYYTHKISDITFATTKPGYKSNHLAFFKAFTFDIWIFLLISVLFMTLGHFLVFKGRAPVWSILFYAVMTFSGKHRNWKPKSKAEKLLVLTWSVGITFLTLSYGAVILSSLTVPAPEKGITNFNELYEAIVKDRVIALKFEGSSTAQLLIESGDEKLKLIGEHMQRQKEINTSGDGKFLQVMKPYVAVVSTRDNLEILYGEGTHFISEDSVFMHPYALYDWTEKGFCCREKINQMIHRMWNAGLNKKILDDYKFREMLHYSLKFKRMYVQEKDSIQPLSLSTLSGPFYFLITGHIFGILCFLIEVVIHKYTRKV